MSFGPIFTASRLEMMQYKGIFLLNGKTKIIPSRLSIRNEYTKLHFNKELEADNKFLRSLKEVTQPQFTKFMIWVVPCNELMPSHDNRERERE